MKAVLILALFSLVVVGGESKDFTAVYQTALIAYKSRDFDAAQVAAQEAVKLNAQDFRPVVLLAKIALARKSYSEAEKILQPVIQKNPDLAYALIPWGDVHVFLGKPGKAIAIYDKATLQETQKPDALLRKVYAYLKNRERDEAQRIEAGMDGFNDKTPVYYFAKAAVMESQGKKAEADGVLKNARTLYGEMVYLDYYRDYLWFLGTK